MEKNRQDKESYLAALSRKGSNSIAGNSFFIFVSRFFPSLANLLVIIWYSKRLPEAVYGQYQHFWIQLYVIYPLICFGIHVLIVTYSRPFIVSLIRRLLPRHYVFYALWVVLFSAVFALLQQGSVAIGFAVPFLFILSFSFSAILESLLIVFRNFRTVVAVNLFYSAAYCAIHWYVWKNGFDMHTVFSLLLAITVLRLLIYSVIAAANIRRTEPEEINIPLTGIRNLWLHLGLYDALQLLSSWIDKFIISIVLTAQLSAVYFNGSQNIPFLPLLLNAASSAVLMQLAAGRKTNDTTDAIQLMLRSGRLLACIVFPVFFYLFTFRTELITTLFSEKYSAAIPVFALSMLVLPVRAYSFTTILQRLHKGAIINIGAVAELVLACGLMYPLYRWYGLPGVALSFVISTYLQAAFYLWFSAKYTGATPLKLIPLADWLIKLIVFATLFIGIHYGAASCFTPKISLFLGAGVMVLAMTISLFMELNKQRKNVSI